MLNVIMSKYDDSFNLYVPAIRNPDIAYIKFFMSDNETEWKLCPIIKLIDSADYDNIKTYYDSAIKEIVNNAHGITGEIIADDYIIYIDVDIDNAIELERPPELNIVGYC